MAGNPGGRGRVLILVVMEDGLRDSVTRELARLG